MRWRETGPSQNDENLPEIKTSVENVLKMVFISGKILAVKINQGRGKFKKKKKEKKGGINRRQSIFFGQQKLGIGSAFSHEGE